MSRPRSPTSVASKVAAVTLAFWVLKILATTLGETAGDFLSMTLGLGYWVALAITGTALVAVLTAQIRAEGYHAALFWTAIVATTTAGTEISDLMDRSLGLGYLWGSMLLTAGLAVTLAVWYRREGHVRVDPIVRRDVETLFWIAVLFSNSLGTAFGDFLTDNAGLSYAQGALVTAAVIALHYAPLRRHLRRPAHQAGRQRGARSAARRGVAGDAGAAGGCAHGLGVAAGPSAPRGRVARAARTVGRMRSVQEA